VIEQSGSDKSHSAGDPLRRNFWIEGQVR
jgi:hypothetical protein